MNFLWIIIAFSGINVHQDKIVTIKVRENSPPMKIFHESDLLVYQEILAAVPENYMYSF